METVNQRSLDAAEKALTAHTDALLLEGGPDIQVWHLLVSLQEYCGAKGIDFNEQLKDSRENMERGELNAPAWERAAPQWVPL